MPWRNNVIFVSSNSKRTTKPETRHTEVEYSNRYVKDSLDQGRALGYGPNWLLDGLGLSFQVAVVG